MPLYTVDNPSNDFAKAEEAAKGLLGDNLVAVTAINMAVPSRVSVETKSAIDSSELAITLAKLVPPKAAVTPDNKGTEVAPVTQPIVPEVAPTVVVPEVTPEPAPPVVVPEVPVAAEPTQEPAPAAPPVKIVP